MKRLLTLVLVSLLVFSATLPPGFAAPQVLQLNVVLNQDLTPQMSKELSKLGKINGQIEQIDALTMTIKADKLPQLLALDFVVAANEDAVRSIGPTMNVPASVLSDYGISTWNLDAINVTDFGVGRVVPQTGAGVTVAVLDTGFVKNWRYFFPEESILTQYARSFGGGGSANAAISEQPNKWQSDVNAHGTHVTSTILGYFLQLADGAAPVNGVAPLAKIIPVKVLNQNGSGSSYVIASAITYVADLKAEIGGPLVINMSLGGSQLDAVEKAAIDYAIEKGVVIVAAAGNEGEGGMGYPAAYEPVISVAASGWKGVWTDGWTGDVAEPIDPMDFHIADFSSRDMVDTDDPVTNHDLDITAPGEWIVGPYTVNQGSFGYYYLSGTSMATPHVAGAVALLLEKYPYMTPYEIEARLAATAVELAPGSRDVFQPTKTYKTFSWGYNATGAGLMDVQALLGN